MRVIENAKKSAKEKRKAKAARAFAKRGEESRRRRRRRRPTRTPRVPTSPPPTTTSWTISSPKGSTRTIRSRTPGSARTSAPRRGRVSEPSSTRCWPRRSARGGRAARRGERRYPSRGEGGAKLARDVAMREAAAGSVDASDGAPGSGGKVAAVRMLKAGREEMGARGAPPGGARGRSVAGAARGRARVIRASSRLLLIDSSTY